MSDSLLSCPTCGSQAIVKNGPTRHGKQNYKCNDCGRLSWCAFPSTGNPCGVAPHFVKNPQGRRISEEPLVLIDRLLLEKISLAGIARILKISQPWLQKYVNEKYEAVPRQVTVQEKPKGRLTVQMDELWSFVDDKGNEQWVWLALDVVTHEIVGFYIGDRSGESAKALWRSLPGIYRQCAVFYSDFWASYPVAFPSSCHRAIAKETGLTSYIERFNGTLRQRVSRLVRETLSFSKKLENHISAIWYFIHHYNASLPVHSSFPF